MRADLATEITNKILNLMEENGSDWRRPWLGDGIAKNIVSKKSYRGVNIPILGLSGYAAQWFGTYKQWSELGAQVRKGEKSTAIFFWKPLHIKDKETEEDRQILMARSYAVFSIEQVENAPTVEIETRPPLERHAECDRIIEATGAQITFGGDRAAYIPSQDRIIMPRPEQFLSPEGYYGTLCHEATHWAGHESRLNRNLKGRFGGETYAFEELIGETGSALRRLWHNSRTQTRYGKIPEQLDCGSQERQARDHLSIQPCATCGRFYPQGRTGARAGADTSRHFSRPNPPPTVRRSKPCRFKTSPFLNSNCRPSTFARPAASKRSSAWLPASRRTVSCRTFACSSD